MKYATCHPDRKHYAHGLCDRCYARARRAPSKRAALCHPERPHVSKGLCRACYMQAWGTANRKRRADAARELRRARPGHDAALQRAWYAENRRVASARSAAKNAKRRASCVATTKHPATAAQRAALVAPGELCLYCETAQAVHVDHFIPIARWNDAPLTAQQRANGPDHISNLVGACAKCNQSKHDRLPDVEWRGRESESA